MDAESLNNDIYAKANELRTGMSDALNQLDSVVSLPYLSWFTPGSFPAFTPQRPSTISIGDLPTLTTAVMPAGSELTTDMMRDYKGKVWQSAELAQLETLMLDYISSGGTGIGQAVEDAIFNRGRERSLQAMRDAFDMAGARTGAKGATFPNQMTQALQKVAITNYQNEKEDLNREIIRLMADLAQKNTQFASGAVIDIEKAYMDFSKVFPEIILNIKKSVLDAFRIEQEARIAEFEGTLKGVLANLEVESKKATLELSYQELLTNKYHIESQNLLERGKAQITEAMEANKIKMSAIDALAKTYATLMLNMQANAISVVKKST